MSDGPERTCVGCRRRRPKHALLRLVRAATGAVTVDARAAQPGRGAYVCVDAACVERALKPGRLAHALRGATVAPGFDMVMQQALRR